MSIQGTITQPHTFWKQIYLLVALEAAITIGWYAYEKYQPILLEKFQFQTLAAFLLIAQGLLGALFHPISGNLASALCTLLVILWPAAGYLGIVLAGLTYSSLATAGLATIAMFSL
jgi:FtsH-binding integral membrane protein